MPHRPRFTTDLDVAVRPAGPWAGSGRCVAGPARCCGRRGAAGCPGPPARRGGRGPDRAVAGNINAHSGHHSTSGHMWCTRSVPRRPDGKPSPSTRLRTHKPAPIEVSMTIVGGGGETSLHWPGEQRSFQRRGEIRSEEREDDGWHGYQCSTFRHQVAMFSETAKGRSRSIPSPAGAGCAACAGIASRLGHNET